MSADDIGYDLDRIAILEARVDALLVFNNQFEARAREAERALKAMVTLTPIHDYHEDIGPVLWWRVPIEEPPYVGTPNDLGHSLIVILARETIQRDIGGWRADWYTHFSPIPKVWP